MRFLLAAEHSGVPGVTRGCSTTICKSVCLSVSKVWLLKWLLLAVLDYARIPCLEADGGSSSEWQQSLLFFFFSPLGYFPFCSVLSKVTLQCSPRISTVLSFFYLYITDILSCFSYHLSVFSILFQKINMEEEKPKNSSILDHSLGSEVYLWEAFYCFRLSHSIGKYPAHSYNYFKWRMCHSIMTCRR